MRSKRPRFPRVRGSHTLQSLNHTGQGTNPAGYPICCVKSAFRRPCPPQWPKVLGAAAVGGAATLFLARNFFPSEKKIHHEIIADYPACDDVFVRVMGNLLGPPLLNGNKVTAFENGNQIFPALLEAIRSAQRTITFESFLFREGEVSDAFADALAERARAGVKVHFLQDALGCDSKPFVLHP